MGSCFQSSPLDNFSSPEAAANYTKEKQDRLEYIALSVKDHEDKVKFLNSQRNSFTSSINELQDNLKKYQLTNSPNSGTDAQNNDSRQLSIKSIIEHGTGVAGFVCQNMSNKMLPIMSGIVGIVAILGRVDDQNISSIFSEYLGMETMLGIVCTTYDCVQRLEVYNGADAGVKDVGLHKMISSSGRHLDGRFVVFCLESLMPYVGGVKENDPQRRLALLKPRLPDGQYPTGFLDFAVNMIHLDCLHLTFLTSGGHGLRETLFYHLFSRLQVYETRADMFRALPFISDGAISLDGGIIRSNGVFYLGLRQSVPVTFPVNDGVPMVPEDIIEMDSKLKLLRWKRQMIMEDIKREQDLVSQSRNVFAHEKKELMHFYAKAGAEVVAAAQMQHGQPAPAGHGGPNTA